MNTTIDKYSNMSQVQKIDICNTMCNVATTMVNQAQSGKTINTNYFFFIGVGGLLIISEALGLTKKVPHNSIIGMVFDVSKKLFTRFVAQNSTHIEDKQPEVEIKLENRA